MIFALFPARKVLSHFQTTRRKGTAIQGPQALPEESFISPCWVWALQKDRPFERCETLKKAIRAILIMQNITDDGIVQANLKKSFEDGGEVQGPGRLEKGEHYCLNARGNGTESPVTRDRTMPCLPGECTAQDPDNAFTHYHIGWNYERGNHKEAAQHLLKPCA